MRGSKGGGAGNSGDPGACGLPDGPARARLREIPREERRRSGLPLLHFENSFAQSRG